MPQFNILIENLHRQVIHDKWKMPSYIYWTIKQLETAENPRNRDMLNLCQVFSEDNNLRLKHASSNTAKFGFS